jgi:hypothetical protein
LNETPRHENQARALIDEIARMEPGQRDHLRRILFWALLAYLEFEWAGTAAIPLGIAAMALAIVLSLMRRTERRHLIVLHGAIVVQLLLALVRAQSWIVLADFAALALLVMLELKNRNILLLLAVAAEHGVALAFDPASALRFLSDHSQPEAAALAWARLFAILMLVAIAVRVRIVPAPAPEPPPPPKPARPMTAAEWDAQTRNR